MKPILSAHLLPVIETHLLELLRSLRTDDWACRLSQIRTATNRPGIMTRELYHPVLDCFMRALPFTYRDRPGEAGTHLRFNVSGECGGSWYLYRGGDRWVQVEEPQGRQLSETTIPQDIAWRIFTKGIERVPAAAQVSVTGDRDLGSHIMSMVAIIG